MKTLSLDLETYSSVDLGKSSVYGGSVGALKAMGAIEMGLKEDELKPLVDAWRTANPMIVKLWREVDRAVTRAVSDKTATETHGIRFTCQSGMLFITLPSGRRLAYRGQCRPLRLYRAVHLSAGRALQHSGDRLRPLECHDDGTGAGGRRVHHDSLWAGF